MTTRIDPHAESIDTLVATHHLRYAHHYGGGLSDHGPMAMLAMRGLDLGDAHIRAFAVSYVEKLEPAELATEKINPKSYPGFVGIPKQYPALLGFFVAEIRRAGTDDVVNRYLPDLLSSWGSAAFHPLIRLGYGLEFDVDGEVAAGLAYAASAGPHPDLEQRTRNCSGRSPIDALAALQQIDAPEVDAGGSFHARYSRVLREPAFDSTFNSIAPPAGGLADLAATAREIFAATHNFFALHLITGTHALRVCLDHLDEVPPDANVMAMCALAAAYVAVGRPDFTATSSQVRDAPAFDYRPHLERTRDEHDIKLAYSCAAQAGAYLDPEYLATARGYLAGRTDRGI